MIKKIFFFLTFVFLACFMVGCKVDGVNTPGLPEESFTITFETNGHGTKPNPIVDVKAIPNSLPILTEEGWKFEGWYKDISLNQEVVLGSNLSSDITLYAKWNEDTQNPIEQTYTISFVNNGHGTKPNSITDVTNIPNTLPVLTEEGYEFEGWYMDASLNQKVTLGSSLSSNITLYAKWKELPVTPPVTKTYTITFETNGHGTKPNSILDVTKIPNTLPVLIEEGYEFEGWYMDASLKQKVTPGSSLSSNITLYAKWKELPVTPPVTKTYTITFETNGHGTEPNSITDVTKIPNTLPVLTEDGYEFEGWYMDASFKQKVTHGSNLSSNITLYAKWKESEPNLEVSYDVENIGLGTIQVTIQTNKSITTYYAIRLERENLTKEDLLNASSTSKTSFTLSNLEETTKYYIYLYSKTKEEETEVVVKEITTLADTTPIELQVSFTATTSKGELKLTITSNKDDVVIKYILSNSDTTITKEQLKNTGELYQKDVLFDSLEDTEYKIYIYAYKNNLDTDVITKIASPLSSIYEQFMDYFSGDGNMPGLFEKNGTPHSMPDYVKETGSIINVMNYGAKANDPTADNFNAFKKAIAAAKTNDTVYIPNGTYYFTGNEKASSEYYAHIILKSNLTLRGESKDGVIIVSCFTPTMNEKNSTTAIAAVNVQNVAIKNITVTSNTLDSVLSYDKDDKDLITDIWTGPKYGITAATGGTITSASNQARNILIDNVVVEKFRRIGIRIAKAQEVVVKNSTFQKATCLGGGGNGYGVCIQGIGHDDDCTDTVYDSCFNVVENCEFIGPWLRHGTLIQYYAHNNLVQNNFYDNTLLDAIDMHGEEEYSNEICNNELINVRSGAAIGLGNSGSTHDATGRNTFIHDNKIVDCLRGIDVILGTPQTVIFHNEIKSNGTFTTYGIYCRDADDVKIINNTFIHVAEHAIYINSYIVWGPSILGIPNNYLIRDNSFLSCTRGISIRAKGENFTIENNSFEDMASNRQIIDDSGKYVMPEDTLTIEIIENQSNYSLKITTDKANVTTYYYLTDKEETPSLSQIKKENSSQSSIIPLTDVYMNKTNYVYVLCVSGQAESLLLKVSFHPTEELPNDSFANLTLGEVEYAQVNIALNNPNKEQIKYLFTSDKLNNPTLSDLTQTTSASFLEMKGLVEETTYYLYANLPSYSSQIISETITTSSWVHFNTSTIDKTSVNIYNASDFYYYVEISSSTSVISSTSASLMVTLHNDIILDENTSIKMIESDFKGVFNGQGYTIYNMKITGNASYLALYKKINAGTFKNTSFVHAEILNENVPTDSSSDHGTAIIAGDLKGSIENVFVFDSRIESKDPDSRVGALAGRLTSNTSSNGEAKIVKCAVVNTVIIGQKHVGGAVGYMDYSQDNTTCKQYVFDLYVSATIYGNENVGGAIGFSSNEIKNVVTDVTLLQNEASTTKKNFGQVAGSIQNSKRPGVDSIKVSSLLAYQDGTVFGNISNTNGTVSLDKTNILLVGTTTNTNQTNLNLSAITKEYLLEHTTFDVQDTLSSIWVIQNQKLILRELI